MLDVPQAMGFLEVAEKLEVLAQSIFVQSTGPKLDEVPDVSWATPRTTDAGTAFDTAGLQLLVMRRLDLDAQPVGQLMLAGTWDAQQDAVKLAAITES